MLDERDDIAVYDASEEENEREAQRHQMRKERAQKMQMEKQRSMKRQRYILLGGYSCFADNDGCETHK